MDSLIQQLTDNHILLAVALILVADVGYVVMTAEQAVPE